MFLEIVSITGGTLASHTRYDLGESLILQRNVSSLGT